MVSEIKLKSFRLFDNVSFKTNNSLIIFSGQNAVGKTTILESIFLCSSTKSQRENDVTNLIKANDNFLIAEIKSDNKQYKVVISKDGKSYFINKKECKKAAEFIGDLKVVLFSPSDINLIDGIKGLRRRFLDLEISLLDKEYLKYLSFYKKILNEKNEILKQKINDNTILNVVTEELIKYLNHIAIKRINFLNELNSYLVDICKNLNIDLIKLEYKPSYNLDQIEKSFNDKLERDIITKTTNIGIHRDDFLVLINNNLASIYASNGQKHIICIAIRLAIKEYIKTKCNEEPILLLDDVFSTLDNERIKKLTEYVKSSKQTFITTTSILGIPDEILKDALVLRIEK